MARTLVAASALLGSYPATPLAGASADLTETAADVGNSNYGVMSGREILIAHNTDASTHHVTISSVADDKNRSGDISAYAIAAGAISVFGPFPKAGWMQSGADAGKIFFSADDATVMFTWLTLPPIS